MGCWGPPPTCCGRGCVGVGAQHCPRGLPALWGLRAAGVVGGHPWRGCPATVVMGAWCQALSLPRPPVLWSGQPGFPTTRPFGRAAGAHYPLAVGGGGAGVKARHQPHSARFCELALRAVGAARGRPGGAPLGWLWGVRGQALSHPKPLVRSGVRPGPTTHWLWVRGLRAWGPVTNPTARALARCGDGMRVPRGGASCLSVGRPGSGTLPPPSTRPFRRAAGAHYPLAVGEQGAGVGTRHQPHSAGSCEVALRALGAARGRPRGRLLPGRGASGDGRSPTPDHPSFRACGRGPLPTCRGCSVRAWGPGCPWHLVPCRGSSCVVRASRVRGTQWPLWLGTCPRAVVVAGSVPLWRASWPCVGAPLLVRSGRSWCLPPPRGLSPEVYWVAARGTWRPAENRAHCTCRWPLLRPGRWARSASYPFGAPQWGCPWRIPPASVLGCVRCGGLACVDPVTDASGFPNRPSCDWGLGRCTTAVSCGRRHRPFPVGGRHDRVPRVCVCVCSLGRVGQAGLLGAFWCASPFPWPFLVRSLLVRPPLCWGCPVCGCCWFFLSFPFPFPPPRCAPVVSCFACFPAPGTLGLGVSSPPPFFLSLLPLPPPLLSPCCLLLCAFSGLGCLGPWRLVPPPPPNFFCPPPPVVSGVSCYPVALGLCTPPPLFFFGGCAVLGGIVCLGPSGVPACASVVLSLSLLCVCWLVLCGVGCWAWLSSAVSWWVLVSCFAGAVLVWPRGSPPCGSAWCVLVFLCPVLCSVALCCCVVVCYRALPFLCVFACACCLFLAAARLLCVFWGVVLCVPCPHRPVRCCAALCWCPFVVLCALSVLFLVAGVVGSWCRCLLLGICWWLWLRGVVVWWCVSALVPVSGLAVARLLPCGVLFPCAVSGGTVLPCGAVLWCPVFFFCFSPCWWRWCPVVPRWFWAPGRFRVFSVSVLCLCGAALACLRSCSLFGALLPSRGWLVFCVVARRVRVFAVGPGCPLLSPGGSWWLLVSCLGAVLWCVPGCCAAPCCCALCSLALRCCALCCFVLLRLVLPRAVLCPGAPSVLLGSCAFWRRVLSCPPALCVFCCGVSLRGVVSCCALCRAHRGVSCCVSPVVSALCGVAVWPALPRCPAPLCCAPWCCAAAWCRGVLSCRLAEFVSCVGVVVPTCTYLRLRRLTFPDEVCAGARGARIPAFSSWKVILWTIVR